MNVYLNLLRVKEYIKNIFVFLPLVFGLKLLDHNAVLSALLAFIGFSFLTSAVYIINDIYDVEEDRRHPVKKNRPLAAGKISKANACLWALGLLLLGLGISMFLGFNILLLFIGYFVFNLLYTLKLKHYPIVDAAAIGASFIFRLFVGSEAADVPLSMWIIIMTFLLALFVAFAKRRDDILIYLNDGAKTRKAVDGYNLEFLNMAMVAMATVLIMAYILYTISPDVISKWSFQFISLIVIIAIGVLLAAIKFLKEEKTSEDKKELITNLKTIWPLAAASFLFILVHTLRAVYLYPWHFFLTAPIFLMTLIIILDFIIKILYRSVSKNLIRQGGLLAGTILLFIYISIIKILISPEIVSAQMQFYKLVSVANYILPESSVVGAWNAGIMGYFFEKGIVVNLDGVVNNKIYPFIKTHQIRRYIKENNIDYIMDGKQAFIWQSRFWNDGKGDIFGDIQIIYSSSSKNKKETPLIIGKFIN